MKEIFRVGAYGLSLEGKQVLLTQQLRGPYKGQLHLPGGGIEFGEDPEQALKREYVEEIACSFSQLTPVHNMSVTGKNEDLGLNYHLMGMIYLVEGLKKVKTEHDPEPHNWYDIASLKRKELSPFARIALEKYLGITFS